MIDAKDLKVGNVFIRELHTSRGLEYDHEFILTENEMGKLFGDNLSLALQDLSGIPLTEDILLKCEGFERSGNEWSLSDEFDIILQESDNKGLWTVANVFVDNHNKANYLCIGDAFKYLHQLQNILHSLTQKELTVQL